MEFISQERNSKIEPIKQELKKLKEKSDKLRQLYLDVAGDTSKQSQVISAQRTVMDQIKETEKKLMKLTTENQIDLEAHSIAHQLDGLEAHNKAVKICHEINKLIADIIPLINEAEKEIKAAREEMPVGLIQLRDMLPIVLGNMEHDMQYWLYIKDKDTLRSKLEKRLAYLQEKQAANIEFEKEFSNYL